MIDLHYRFVPMGTTAEPDPGRLYLDVGNRFGPGLIDHHQPDGPDRCTAALVLEQAAAIRAQARALPAGQPLELVTHRQPDLDAITAIHFVESLVKGPLPRPAADLWAAAVALVRADLGRYRADLARAERLMVALPRTAAGETERVPGLWIAAPDSLLFKAWARGDTRGAGDPRGFVFTAVALSPSRVILSVQPGLGLWLRGLGEALEAAETAKRLRLNRPRRGAPRPGYAGPDPWYDGRSPLHGYTIVDAPHGGTLLDPAEIRAVFTHWLGG